MPQSKNSLDIHTSVTTADLAQEALTALPQRVCQLAIATYAYDVEHHSPHLFALGCRKWSCQICGPRKRHLLIRRITQAAPNKFVTLTCRHEQGVEKQLNCIKRAIPKLTTKIRKEYGTFEYLRALEYCNDGYPHYHLLARVKYIPQQWLSETWKSLTGAPIVHIAKAHGKSTKYVAKYMSKATATKHTWTRQQFAVSRNFWTDRALETAWLNWSTRRIPAYEAALAICDVNTLDRKALGCYEIIPGRTEGADVPFELLPHWFFDETEAITDDETPFDIDK